MKHIDNYRLCALCMHALIKDVYIDYNRIVKYSEY